MISAENLLKVVKNTSAEKLGEIIDFTEYLNDRETEKST